MSQSEWKDAEAVVLTVIANDGNKAICTASINGTVVDEVEFLREEASAEEFLVTLAVGNTSPGKRMDVDENGFADAKEEMFHLRQAARGGQKPGRCRG